MAFVAQFMKTMTSLFAEQDMSVFYIPEKHEEWARLMNYCSFIEPPDVESF